MDPELWKQVDALLEQRVAGFVFLALIERTPQLAASLKGADVPIVAIGLRQEWTDSVGPRDREGGSLAARHLLDLGHRRIGYVRTATAEAGGDRARHAGYASELRSAGIEPSTPMWWEPGSGTIRVGRRPMPLRDALSGPAAPTAVFVWNDHGAIGLIEACEASGISVPRDLSVVGFDDTPTATTVWPELTTVRQPIAAMAGSAIELLLRNIRQRKDGEARVVSDHVMAHVLIKRDSVAAPREG